MKKNSGNNNLHISNENKETSFKDYHTTQNINISSDLIKNEHNLNNNINSSLSKDFNIQHNNESSLIDIQVKLEELFKIFSESTDFVLSYSKLSAIKNEPDMNNSTMDLERKEFERIDNEKMNNFNKEIENYSELIINKISDLENSISDFPDKDKYLKTEEELKEELNRIKLRQQEKIDSVKESVEVAKEVTSTIEQGIQRIEMFHDLMP